MNNEIYFCGSIHGGRDDAAVYARLIKHLRKYGTVLTEHVGDEDLLEEEKNLSTAEVHDRDVSWLRKAKTIVAEVTQTSTGVGYEIGRSVERNEWVSPEQRQHILCLYRLDAGKKLSPMIEGGSGIVMKKYNALEEAFHHIDDFFHKIKEQ